MVLYVKPWDDETDMKEVERLVRGIEMDGLLWGTGKSRALGTVHSCHCCLFYSVDRK